MLWPLGKETECGEAEQTQNQSLTLEVSHEPCALCPELCHPGHQGQGSRYVISLAHNFLPSLLKTKLRVRRIASILNNGKTGESITDVTAIDISKNSNTGAFPTKRTPRQEERMFWVRQGPSASWERRKWSQWGDHTKHSCLWGSKPVGHLAKLLVTLIIESLGISRPGLAPIFP